MKVIKLTTAVLSALALFVMAAVSVQAGIDGITQGANGFTLTAKSGYISTPEGNSVYFWGFANGDDGTVQYPGPTLIVNQGDLVTVTLNNQLFDANVSIVFPGQQVTTATTGAAGPGLLTEEAPPGEAGTVTYTFTAAEPGTYLYHSGTRPDLQIDMGLFGALIVRPATPGQQAYNHVSSAFDDEFLFLLSEMDPKIHRLVEQGRMDEVDTTAFFPAYWFINGRCAPDTMFPPGVSWLPTQPYNILPMIEPGQKLLMRIVGGGRDLHPFHHHGNHALVIAKDGRLLESAPGSGADLAYQGFTVPSVPGQTVDAIFTWTGEGMGWDIYGHGPDDPLAPGEDPEDHGKPFPVLLPETQDLAYGGFWSGSPFLAALGNLPPGEGGLNPMGAFTFMWHSHSEKELTNNDVFPGGQLTMTFVVPPGFLTEAAEAEALPLEEGANPLSGQEGGN